MEFMEAKKQILKLTYLNISNVIDFLKFIEYHLLGWNLKSEFVKQRLEIFFSHENWKLRIK